jgi:hypothetical protein
MAQRCWNGAPKSLNLARPERFELPTSWFVAMRSIQLSYGRAARCRALGFFEMPSRKGHPAPGRES